MYKKIFLLVFYVYKCRGDGNFRLLKKFKIFDQRAAMWDSLRKKKIYCIVFRFSSLNTHAQCKLMDKIIYNKKGTV